MAGIYKYAKPYPYDCIIAGTPVMLFHDLENGVPGWREKRVQYFVESIVLSQEDRTYQQFPPEVEFPYAIVDLEGGAGEIEQNRDFRFKYWYAQYVDASSGKPVMGPKMNSHTAMSAAGTHAIGFNSALYIAAGRYLYKRADDTAGGLTQVHDFGVTEAITDLAVYQGSQTEALLFIALGTADNYYTMNSAESFSQHASQSALKFAEAGRDLWLITLESNQWTVRKTENGGTSATWLAGTNVGDGNTTVKAMKLVANSLLVCKTDGIYGLSIETDQIDMVLTPELKSLNASTNMASVGVWAEPNSTEALHFTYAGSLFRYDPQTGALQQFGPETADHIQADVSGQVSAAVGQPGICLWAVLSNGTSGDSFLWRYGGGSPKAGHTALDKEFIQAWHGALYEWDSLTCGAIHITNVVSSKPRLYIFMTNGAVYWMKLARTQNVMDDLSYYEFNSTNTGYIYLPRYTANFPFETKLLKGVGLQGRNLSGGARTLGAEYKVPTDAVYTSIGSTATDPGEKLELPSVVTSNAFDFRITFTNTTASNSPQLTATVIYSALRTEPLKEIFITVRIGDKILDKEGRAMRLNWYDLKTAVEEAVTAAGSVTVISPTGESLTVIGIDFANSYFGDTGENEGPMWRGTVRMVQTASSFTRGTWERVAAYTWGDIASFTWAGVAVI